MDTLEKISKDPKEKQMYEDIKTEEFLQRISENNIRKESFTKGEDTGIIKRRTEEKKEIVKEMLKNNFTIEQIKSITKLTEKEIEKAEIIFKARKITAYL